MNRYSLLVLTSLLLSVVGACSDGDCDLERLACPAGQVLVSDEDGCRTCQTELEADTGAVDSGRADSGGADSGEADSGGADSGGADSGGTDTGGMDSGSDAGPECVSANCEARETCIEGSCQPVACFDVRCDRCPAGESFAPVAHECCGCTPGCTETADCGSSAVCTMDGACEALDCSLVRCVRCPAGTSRNPPPGECCGCTTDCGTSDDCTDTEECIAGACLEVDCRNVMCSECGPGEVASPEAHGCCGCVATCTVDTDCAERDVCNAATALCEAIDCTGVRCVRCPAGEVFSPDPHECCGCQPA